MAAGKQTKVTATVVGLNKKKGTITLKGPRGRGRHGDGARAEATRSREGRRPPRGRLHRGARDLGREAGKEEVVGRYDHSSISGYSGWRASRSATRACAAATTFGSVSKPTSEGCRPSWSPARVAASTPCRMSAISLHLVGAHAERRHRRRAEAQAARVPGAVRVVRDDVAVQREIARRAARPPPGGRSGRSADVEQHAGDSRCRRSRASTPLGDQRLGERARVVDDALRVVRESRAARPRAAPRPWPPSRAAAGRRARAGSRGRRSRRAPSGTARARRADRAASCAWSW